MLLQRWLLRRVVWLRVNLARRAVAEGLGTAFLLAAIVGSGVMADTLASGNVAIALLANTVATASALLALIVTFGPVSGAHFNPLVTGLLLVRGELPRRDVPAYVGAQMLGALTGVVTAHLMFRLPAVSYSTHARAGLARGFAEAVATYGLLLVIALGARFRPTFVPVAVAAYIAAAYWFTSSTSFANPAVTMARALTDTFAGIRPADVSTFLLGQIVGWSAAALTLMWLLPSRETVHG